MGSGFSWLGGLAPKASALSARLARAFDLRAGEGKMLSLLFAHAFTLGAGNVFFETPANTLFLQHYNITWLPYVYILTAVASVLIGVLYTWLDVRVPPRPLFLGTLIILTSLSLLLYVAVVVTGSPWLSFALMVWKDVQVVLLVLEFWAVAGAVFNLQQGKRLFGLVASGEVLATIAGGVLISAAADIIGAGNLLIGAVLANGLGILVLLAILHEGGESFEASSEEEGGRTQESHRPLMGLLRQRYIVMFFAISVCSTFGFYLVEYIFLEQVQVAIPSADALAGFLGAFTAVTGVANLLANVFLSQPMLVRFGVRVCVLLLPAAVGMGAGASFIGLAVAGAAGIVFWSIVVTKLMNEVLEKSIEAPVYRIFYQPLLRSDRLRVQTIRESIIEPATVGLSGLLLAVATGGLGLDSRALVGVLVALSGGWLIVALSLRKDYVVALQRVFRQRRLSGEELSLHDASTQDVLELHARGESEFEAMYALALLEKFPTPRLGGLSVSLLDHPSPIVRERAARLLGRFWEKDARAAIETRIAKETVPRVKGTFLREFCHLGGQEAAAQAAGYLNDSSPEIRAGAIVGVMKNGGKRDQEAAERVLLRLAYSQGVEDRLLAARALREINEKRLSTILRGMLQDTDDAVCAAAMLAVTQRRDLGFLSFLVAILEDGLATEPASKALIGIGEASVEEIEKALSTPASKRAARIRLIRLLGRIGGVRAAEVLWRQLDFPDPHVREAALLGLVNCSTRGDGAANKAIRRLRAEAAAVARDLAAIQDLSGSEGGDILIRALRDEVRRSRQTVIHLLALMHPNDAVFQAGAGLVGPSEEMRSNALEVLDNLIADEIKPILFALFDDMPDEWRLDRLNRSFPPKEKDFEHRLQAIFTDEKRLSLAWTKACIFYAMGALGRRHMQELAKGALSDTNFVVKETADWYISRLENTKSLEPASEEERAWGESPSPGSGSDCHADH